MDDVLELRQRMKTLVIDTFAHFAVHPRSIGSDDAGTACMYYGQDDARCAASLRMREDESVRNEVKEYEGQGVKDIIDALGDEVFLPHWRGFIPDFWDHVQDIHDTDANWEGSGEEVARRRRMGMDDFLKDIDKGEYDLSKANEDRW